MSLLDLINFKYCPSCGGQQLQLRDDKSFVCASCGFLYYHGTNAAAVAIIEYKDKIILTRRANEPFKGVLSLPGGFVDYEENLEEALLRELREELNLDAASPVYLCSNWDRYPFHGVVYFTIVAFYVVRVVDISAVTANDDIDAFELVRPAEVDFSQLAFDSDRVALKTYLDSLQGR